MKVHKVFEGFEKHNLSTDTTLDLFNRIKAGLVQVRKKWADK